MANAGSQNGFFISHTCSKGQADVAPRDRDYNDSALLERSGASQRGRWPARHNDRKSCIGCLNAIERHLAATRPPICEGVAAGMLAAYDGGRSATSPRSCFRRRNHGAMAKQPCPSSSTVARQLGMRYRRQMPPIGPGASPRDLAAQHGSVDAVRMNFPTPVRSAQEENP
jgi:hypothetical protein